MGTITFEKTSFTPTTIKTTKFFTANVSIDTADTSVSIASGTNSTAMYTGEVSNTLSECTYRSFELYIDDDSDLSSTPETAGDGKGAYRTARVTYDADKTVADGYDVYVNKDTITTGTLSDGFNMQAKRLADNLDVDGDGDTEPVYFRLVVVTEV